MNKKQYIEKLFKNKPIMLAPMAGYTDIGFRYLCKKYGADVVFTEMINVSALCYKNKKTFDMLQFLSAEKPIAVQLFGNDPEKFKKAVGLISDYDFDIIDINMGCPAPKIVKNKEGSYLLEDIDLAEKIIKAVVSATDKPVSVKFRLGVDDDYIVALEFAKMCEKAGASFISVHCRTRVQGYSGKADWSWIEKIKEVVKIPVVANGDCLTVDDYKALIYLGADGVMVGRGAVGNPVIFKEIKLGQNIELSLSEKIAEIEEHAKILLEHFSINFVSATMKKHILQYLKKTNLSVSAKLAVAEFDNVLDMINYLKQCEN